MGQFEALNVSGIEGQTSLRCLLVKATCCGPRFRSSNKQQDRMERLLLGNKCTTRTTNLQMRCTRRENKSATSRASTPLRMTSSWVL